jgi:hypothetical protein
METIQELRHQALAAGNLKSGAKQKVVVKSAAAETEHEGEYAGNATKQYIEIESANPRVVYVPVYDSTVVYGQYSYPAYSHYTYYSDGSAYAARGLRLCRRRGCGSVMVLLRGVQRGLLELGQKISKRECGQKRQHKEQL